MSYLIQKLKGFPITFGTLTLSLSGYQLSETSAIREAGAADGATVLAGFWKKGCRLKLKGKLAPSHTSETVISTLAQNMLAEQTLSLGSLSFTHAMLCGYSVTEQQDTPELILLFYCPESPTVQEESAP